MAGAGSYGSKPSLFADVEVLEHLLKKFRLEAGPSSYLLEEMTPS
jgi:hypothetical protein